MSNPLPDTKQPASPPDDGLLGDVEMEDQQNNAAATDAVDATTATLNNTAAATSFEEGSVEVNNAALIPAPPPSEYSTDVVADATRNEFQVGMEFENEDELVKKIKAFAEKNLFTAAKRERGLARCSKATNSWSKRKAEGGHVLQIKDSSQVTDCQWFVKWSTGRFTKITGVNAMHNHPCDVSTAPDVDMLNVTSSKLLMNGHLIIANL